MPATSIHVPVEKPRTRGPAPDRADLLVGGLLLLLLAFATATVFVRAAWALQSFQIGIYALLAGCMLWGVRLPKGTFDWRWPSWLVYLIPLWGVLQIVARTTASTFETRHAVLRWGALAGVFVLAQIVGKTPATRRAMLSVFVWFATAIAVLCLMQLFTSQGRVFWIFPTGYPDVYATFPSHNNYAQFAELALPVALWRALREGWRSWWYALASGVIYASAIGSASRAGAALCTVELLVVLIFSLTTLGGRTVRTNSRGAATVLVCIPILAALFTAAVGWERVWERFKENDPYLIRREFLISAVDMAKQQPVTGYGLDTFPEVYQRYAIKDFPFIANHAHNDWAEFAADGGVPFLLLVLIPCLGGAILAVKHPWGFGLIAVLLHACVDYPFPRPAVSGWVFAILGLLYVSRVSRDRRYTA